MGAPHDVMPADPLWSWRASDDERNDAVALAGAVIIFGGGGFVGGLVADGWGSPASWMALVVGTSIGLVMGGLIIVLGRRRDDRTWAVLTPDGRLTFRELRKHQEIDLRAEPTVHAVHLVSEIKGTGGQYTRRFEYTLIGTGPTPRFKGMGHNAPTPRTARLDGGIRIPMGSEQGLIEAMSAFTEVVKVPGEIIERNKRVKQGFPG